MQLLYNNSKVQKQCTDLKTAKKLFGGNAALATSLFARINAMQQASVISENAIRRFAERIDRDPGIVLGRLQNDQIVPFTNVALSKALKHKYKVITS